MELSGEFKGFLYIIMIKKFFLTNQKIVI